MGKDIHKNRTWFMTRPRCEFSELRVTHPDVFISRYPKSNYLAEIAKLGETILLVKEYGYLTSDDLTDVLHHIDKYVSRHYAASRKIAFIIDIKNLEGSDSEARKRYIDYLKNNDTLASVVFFNLSTLFKFSYKLTKRLHSLNDRLYAVDTYPQAIDLTRKLIAEKPDAVDSFHAHHPGFDLTKPLSKKNTPLAETMAAELKLFMFNVINRINGVATEYYVEELLRHIQSIDWYDEGFVSPDSNVYKHPHFRKIIDAIEFIKSEVDTLLNERAKTELILREREAKYRQLVEHAKAGILEYDYPTNRIVHVNEYFLKITEYLKDEVLAMNPLELLTEQSRKRFLQRLNRLMGGEKISQDVAYELVTRSGKKKRVLFNTHIVYQGDMPQRANVVVTDITKLAFIEKQDNLIEF